MKKSNILNAEIIKEIASAGHTQSLVIADAGLPIPQGTKVIDLALVKGVPSFSDVLSAVCSELVVESYVYASEAEQANPAIVDCMQKCLPDIPKDSIPHEDFKTLSSKANVIIRTGECTSYANVILIAGVNF